MAGRGFVGFIHRAAAALAVLLAAAPALAEPFTIAGQTVEIAPPPGFERVAPDAPYHAAAAAAFGDSVRVLAFFVPEGTAATLAAGDLPPLRLSVAENSRLPGGLPPESVARMQRVFGEALAPFRREGGPAMPLARFVDYRVTDMRDDDPLSFTWVAVTTPAPETGLPTESVAGAIVYLDGAYAVLGYEVIPGDDPAGAFAALRAWAAALEAANPPAAD